MRLSKQPLELKNSAEARAESQARRQNYPDAYFRMPLGFGPFPGPRQTEDGLSRPGWPSVAVTTSTLTFKASKAHLSTYLPHKCFSIDCPSDKSFASLCLTSLENLPWLDGRGYLHYGFYIHDVICKGKDETVRGKYLVVLFENRADPIMSGREELGYAKLYCELENELLLSRGTYSLEASWDGTVFGVMGFKGLQKVTGGEVPETSFKPADGILNFKYIPATGRPGVCDVQYPTFSPNAEKEETIIETVLVAESASFAFGVENAARLPTLSHVVAGLAEIQLTEIVDARVVISKGQSDLRNQRAISI
jgi:hypothetical protein